MTFDDYLIEKRKQNMRLPSLVRYYQKQYNPLLDVQICLAHVINCLIRLGFKVSKNEIYYCFKKNYTKEFHRDIGGYLKFLYSLAHPFNKKKNNSISEHNNAFSPPILNIIGKHTPTTPLSTETAYKPHQSISGGDFK